MDWLPMELATDDLASLWATCSFMRRVCDIAEVSQHIPLRRVLQRQGFWERHYYDNDYRTLLTTMLASVGNCNRTNQLPIVHLAIYNNNGNKALSTRMYSARLTCLKWK
jgi:hypothetical protein